MTLPKAVARRDRALARERRGNGHMHVMDPGMPVTRACLMRPD